jgi:hypothetical protein
VVPIHYGASGASGYEEDPRAEAKLVEISKARKVAAHILKPNEWLRWDN